MGLAEAMATGNEGDGFLGVHRYAAAGGSDVLGGGEVVAAGVRALGIHVDQAHVRRCERLFQIAVAREALVGGEPLGLATPTDVVVRFPDVLATGGEAER